MHKVFVAAAIAALSVVLFACSSSEDLPPSVFDGVSDDDLAQFDIRVVDYHPASTPALSDAGLRRALLESPGVTIDSSQLVTAVATGYSARVAWAIRVNRSHVPDWVAGCNGPSCQFGPGRPYTIMFYDAATGQTIGSFTRIPTDETPFVGTQPPTP